MSDDIGLQVDRIFNGIFGLSDHFNELIKNPKAPRRVRRLRETAIRIAADLEQIRKLRAECSHQWHMRRQVALGNGVFQRTFKCQECDATKTNEGPPLCTKCETPLHKASVKDVKANNELISRQAEVFIALVAYRCPQCGAVHILPDEYERV